MDAREKALTMNTDKNKCAGSGQASHEIPTADRAPVLMCDGGHRGTWLWLDAESGKYCVAPVDWGTCCVDTYDGVYSDPEELFYQDNPQAPALEVFKALVVEDKWVWCDDEGSYYAAPVDKVTTYERLILVHARAPNEDEQKVNAGPMDEGVAIDCDGPGLLYYAWYRGMSLPDSWDLGEILWDSDKPEEGAYHADAA